MNAGIWIILGIVILDFAIVISQMRAINGKFHRPKYRVIRGIVVRQ